MSAVPCIYNPKRGDLRRIDIETITWSSASTRKMQQMRARPADVQKYPGRMGLIQMPKELDIAIKIDKP